MMRSTMRDDGEFDALRHAIVQGKPLSLQELKAISAGEIGRTKTYVVVQSGEYLYFFKSYGKSGYLVPFGVKVYDGSEKDLIFF